MSEPIRMGMLVSSKGNKLQAIIDACETGLINGRVVFVCSDNAEAFALTRAKRYGIPTFIVEYTEIRDRFREEPQTLQLPAECNFDHILARQMVFDGGWNGGGR
ncbi:MAG: formyltransferase family protein [Syntrophobacteraceae bacterium]